MSSAPLSNLYQTFCAGLALCICKSVEACCIDKSHRKLYVCCVDFKQASVILDCNVTWQDIPYKEVLCYSFVSMNCTTSSVAVEAFS